MRAVLVACLLLTSPALADELAVSSRVTAVTVFPQGAEITREVVFAAEPGAHQILVTDLPADTVPSLIRLTPADDTRLGSFALRTDRLSPQEDPANPALLAARDEVAGWEAKEQAALAAVEAIMAKVQAAEAQAGFLSAVKADGGTVTPEALKQLSATIGAEVLAAKQASLMAKADLPPAQKALKEVQEALAKARAAESAVLTRAEDYAVLTIAATVANPGEHRLTITHFIDAASWTPVYDLMLTRETPELSVKRSVLVTQYSAEDWIDVDMTLSTAQPGRSPVPSQLYPEQRYVRDPAKEASDAYAGGMAEPVMEPAMVEAAAPVESALAGFQGDTIVYHYPVAVSVARGVDNVRFALDDKSFAPKVFAQAVPQRDSTAYLMAKITNASGEMLLPGEANHYREGVFVGQTWLDALPAGAEATYGFGAIEGLRLKRDMPLRAEGDRGLLGGSTELSEKAVLSVENLTQESWPVRLIDRIPYSEQEELEITYEASPSPTETDVDGQRGILAWEFDIAPAEIKEVALNHALRWPEGKELQ